MVKWDRMAFRVVDALKYMCQIVFFVKACQELDSGLI